MDHIEYRILVCRKGREIATLYVHTTHKRTCDILSLAHQRIARANLEKWDDAIVMRGDDEIGTFIHKEV